PGPWSWAFARRPSWPAPSTTKNATESASFDSCTAATAPPPAASSHVSVAWTISPDEGTCSTRTNSIISTCPTTAARIRGMLTNPRPPAFHDQDARRADDSAVRALLRAAPCRGDAAPPAPARRRARRRRVPGDLPAGVAGVWAPRPRGAPEGVGADDRTQRGDRHPGAGAADHRAPRPRRRGGTTRVRGARAAHRRLPAEGSRRRRAPLRLRPSVRPDRVRARLDYHLRPAGRIDGRAKTPKDEEPT